MFTLNLRVGKVPGNWLARIARGAGFLLTIYILVLSALSLQYVGKLIHPTCPTTDSLPDGAIAVSIPLNSEINLNGWWFPAQNGRAILLLGGNGATRDTMVPEAEILANQGYGALTMDYRQCAGEPVTLGYSEVEELTAGLSFIKSQSAIEKIGVLGFSVGGTTVIRGAAILPEISAVVAEGNYANLYQEMTANTARPLSLEWQAQRLVILSFWLETGIFPSQLSPIDSIDKISPRPILLIFGEKEIERAQGLAQYQAAGTPKELWIVPGAGHGEYLAAAPESYRKRILDFFNQSLK